jgi:hypothetical protein
MSRPMGDVIGIGIRIADFDMVYCSSKGATTSGQFGADTGFKSNDRRCTGFLFPSVVKSELGASTGETCPFFACDPRPNANEHVNPRHTSFCRKNHSICCLDCVA